MSIPKIHLLYIYILALLILSCTESKYDEVKVASLKGRYLNVSDSTLSIAASSGSNVKTYVECMKNSWIVSGLPNWLKATPERSLESTDVTITATEDNPSADNIRMSIFSIESDESDWNWSSPISITQGKNLPYITPEIEELILNFEKQGKNIPIKCNCNYEISTSGETWLSCNQSNDGQSVSINAEQNYSNESRTAYIYLKAKEFNYSTAIRVIQSISNITTTTDTIKVENGGGDFSLNVTSETDWTATCSQAWLSLSTEKGTSGTTALNVSVSPNPRKWRRTAFIYLSVGSTQRIEIPIVQNKSILEVSQSDISLPSKGGNVNITINANAPWTITIPKETYWLSIDSTKGENEGSCTISAQDNPSANNRNSQITIDTKYGMQCNLAVEQDARYLNLSTPSIFINRKGGKSEPILIQSDGKYKIENPLDWVTTYLDEESNALTLTAHENETGYFREGFITIQLTDLSDGSELKRNIKIYQTGGDSSSFFINRFDNDDKDWNFYKNASISISINGFSSTDKNWTPK